MERVCLGKLGKTITAYLSHPEAVMPLVLAGKPGIGKTEVIKMTLASMCLRHRELWDLLGRNPDSVDEADVVLVHTLDPDRVRLDLGSAVSFQARFGIPVIVSTPVADGTDPVWKQFEGKVFPVFCQQVLGEFAAWAGDTYRWEDGQKRPRIHPLLLEFLKKNPSFFEKDRWHSPFMMEQISHRWWEATDIILKAVREEIGDDGMAAEVSKMLFIKDIR